MLSIYFHLILFIIVFLKIMYVKCEINCLLSNLFVRKFQMFSKVNQNLEVTESEPFTALQRGLRLLGIFAVSSCAPIIFYSLNYCDFSNTLFYISCSEWITREKEHHSIERKSPCNSWNPSERRGAHRTRRNVPRLLHFVKSFWTQ